MKASFKSIATTFKKWFAPKVKNTTDNSTYIQKEEKKVQKDWKGEPLYPHPYNGTNNRKKTLGRLKADAKIQSIPCYEKDEFGRPTKLLGYRYVPVNEKKKEPVIV